MYPTTVREFDGSVCPCPVSILRDQLGTITYFLVREIVQLLPGACQVKMYDRRDHMPTLALYIFFS